uniref:ATP synthase subunit a n=1 Tax=Diplectrona hexapetala (nom. nud.) TaxID=2904920 RepID=A0A9E8RUP5_9NEOP|nr:ATP synthase F0 subunit 6 [Diplectrona hexapetala (nom. nud.)]UZZ43861.1 ATP synthase F0 subunit 6 [Diplectrona hexapetala (nom. nud.)]
MNNLFSIFDPSSMLFNLHLNWLSSSLIILFLPLTMWFTHNRSSIMFSLIMNSVKSEINNLLKSYSFKGVTLIFIALFMMILFNNLLGLFPYIFTSTSHLTFNLTFSLPIWLAIMLYGWINKTQHMFSHLIPQGTPALLMPFMVLIETISNIIRPLTLSIRLTANMIAGHLLITLLSSSAPSASLIVLSLIIVSEIALLVLEFSVAIIQSYVFTILGTLYTSEV